MQDGFAWKIVKCILSSEFRLNTFLGFELKISGDADSLPFIAELHSSRWYELLYSQLPECENRIEKSEILTKLW